MKIRVIDVLIATGALFLLGHLSWQSKEIYACIQISVYIYIYKSFHVSRY